MILVFGGTTEGRLAVDVLEGAGKRYFYSTFSTLQQVAINNGIRLSGAMESSAIAAFCSENGISLIVDAAHPFAENLHRNIYEASQATGIPVIRLERHYPERSERIIWCRSYNDAIKRMEADGVEKLLALSGVKTIAKLKEFWQRHNCIFRILDREESRQEMQKAGFPEKKSIFYSQEGAIGQLLDEYSPDAIILKESGDFGHFEPKAGEAIDRGVRVYAVERPKMPESFVVATGPHTLRREVERLLPGFFELRSGVTTGTCAAVAAKAALATLLNNDEYRSVTVTLPGGEIISLPVSFTEVLENGVSVGVVKDAGDDPDVTNGAVIVAKVSYSTREGIHFFGGEGVGTVTLPGLGIEVGGPAINPVPRRMITAELRELYSGGLNVTISVPGGEELAKRTFNSRVGVIGGISIIGTSGIVQPFSHEAFLVAIRRELEVALASGAERVVLNSGARSERAVKGFFPNLPSCAFVHYGNAVGDTLQIADSMGFRAITLGLMVGKAVKLAEGKMDTHSHKVLMNTLFLKELAIEAGCDSDTAAAVGEINMARDLWNMPKEQADLFFTKLLKECLKHCRAELKGEGRLSIMLISDEGEIKYQLNEE